MNCKEIKKLLQLYHDGELDSAKRSEIESHLAECQACQAELAELAALDDMIRDGEAEKVPDPGTHYWSNFTHRVTRRLTDNREPIIKRRRVQPMRFRLIPYLSAGVAIILALVIAIPFLKNIPTRFTEQETMSMHDVSNFKQEAAPGFRRIDELDTDIASDEELAGLEAREAYYEISSDIAESEEEVLFPAVSPSEPSYQPSGMGGDDNQDIEAGKAAEGRGGTEEKVLPKAVSGKEAENGDERGLFGILFPKSKSPDQTSSTSTQPESSGAESAESGQETSGQVARDGFKGAKPLKNDADIPAETVSTTSEKNLTGHSLTDKTATKLSSKENNERIAGERRLDSEPESGYFDYKRQFVPRADVPQPGTLQIVTDSIGQLVSVTVYQSCGDPTADTSAINAYWNRWQNRVFRQRSAFYIPYSKE